MSGRSKAEKRRRDLRRQRWEARNRSVNRVWVKVVMPPIDEQFAASLRDTFARVRAAWAQSQPFRLLLNDRQAEMARPAGLVEGVQYIRSGGHGE